MPSRGNTVALQPYLLSIATSLSRTDPSIPDWLIVSPERALKNSVATVAGTGSSIQAITATLFAFGSVGAGLYLYVWKNIPLRSALTWLSSKFTASISIASTHPLNKDVLTYLEKNGLSNKTKSLALVNPNAVFLLDDPFQAMYEQASGRSKPQLEDQKSGPPTPEPLEYIPISGSYSFWHNGYRLGMTRLEEVRGFYKDDGRFIRTQNGPSDLSLGQTITLTCWSFGAGVQPLKDFLEHVREAAIPSKQNTTTIFRASCHRDTQKFDWDTGVIRPARTVDSIALEAGKKEALIKECKRYFSDAEQRFYASRGLPYRRGLLFYGPPGTGKSSFVVALAGHFKLNVYMISLSDEALNDRGLGKLLDALPKRCIVLLEDVDSSGIDREPLEVKVTAPSRPGKVSKKTVLVGVTLAGLLNVLDGPASGVGRLVVMTSNVPDSLDAALLRPGRIDNKVLFGYANKEISSKIFTHIFTKTTDEISPDEVQEQDEMAQFSPHDIQLLGDQFAACIPETKISPAEVQGFLMRHRDDPLTAVRDAAAWAKETLEIKEAGANVAFFENEVKFGGLAAQRARPNGVNGVEGRPRRGEGTRRLSSSHSELEENGPPMLSSVCKVGVGPIPPEIFNGHDSEDHDIPGVLPVDSNALPVLQADESP